jgi:hypothetical protein
MNGWIHITEKLPPNDSNKLVLVWKEYKQKPVLENSANAHNIAKKMRTKGKKGVFWTDLFVYWQPHPESPYPIPKSNKSTYYYSSIHKRSRRTK